MAKEPKDILDENVIERLNAANPTNRDIAEGLKLVIRMLWSKEQLEEYIDTLLDEKCANCELRRNATLPAACAASPDVDPEPAGLTRRHVMIEVVKAPWFWLVVATACAAVCSCLGISLPTVGGGQ